MHYSILGESMMVTKISTNSIVTKLLDGTSNCGQLAPETRCHQQKNSVGYPREWNANLVPTWPRSPVNVCEYFLTIIYTNTISPAPLHKKMFVWKSKYLYSFVLVYRKNFLFVENSLISFWIKSIVRGTG